VLGQPSLAARVAMLALGLGLGACHGGLGEAVSQFESGQYPAAKRSFEWLEAEADGWSPSQRAEYALYRGLTLDALGDEIRAAGWVRRAAAIESSHPGALSSTDAQRLNLVAPALLDDHP